MNHPFRLLVRVRHRWRCATVAGVLLLSSASAIASESPTFLFEPLLDTWLSDQNGQINFFMKSCDIALPSDASLGHPSFACDRESMGHPRIHPEDSTRCSALQGMSLRPARFQPGMLELGVCVPFFPNRKPVCSEC